ncbi:MAG TPA: NUDIX hydrolase [Pseudonocardiaceae bacterium]|nr:NUDIX hydrolase [Pseudonocardiaceae bacterium]
MAGLPQRRIRCVGAVVFDEDGRLLLIRRAQEPGRGRWSVPGGRVEPGETDHQALIREVAEETGLTVEIIRLLGRVHRNAPGDAVFDIDDYLCRPAGGALAAGDDAEQARWCDASALASLPLVPGLLDALTHWQALPRPLTPRPENPDMSPYRASAAASDPDMSPYRGQEGHSGGGGAGA